MSDALELAALCDSVVLVISARAYKGPVELRTVREFERQGIPLEGIILTRHDEYDSPGALPHSWLGRLMVWSGLKP